MTFDLRFLRKKVIDAAKRSRIANPPIAIPTIAPVLKAAVDEELPAVADVDEELPAAADVDEELPAAADVDVGIEDVDGCADSEPPGSPLEVRLT